MITKIVAQLKTGSVKNVYPFGMMEEYPISPYVVVKPESAPGGIRNYRIIAHFPPDYITDLEDYAFNEISVLLEDFEATDRHGNTVRLFDAEQFTDILSVSDDKTISMERVYFTPSRLH
jgi:hypothetical protein